MSLSCPISHNLYILILWYQGDPCDTAKASKKKGGPIVTHQGLVQPRGHCDTAGLYGITETIVTLCGLMEPRGQCVIVQYHGTKESILTQQSIMETRDHCDTVEPHGNKRPV